MLNNQKWIELAKYIYQIDPAARSWQEVYELYPGFKAIRDHATAHELYKQGDFFEARKIAEAIRRETGIEIHPGARIADYVFIDHGMGVVIGETAKIGNRVTLYHGVSLGGTGTQKACQRHPIIEDDCEIGAGAILLGPIVIGHHSKIGAGAVVIKDVPPYSIAVGVPAQIRPQRAIP